MNNMRGFDVTGNAPHHYPQTTLPQQVLNAPRALNIPLPNVFYPFLQDNRAPSRQDLVTQIYNLYRCNPSLKSEITDSIVMRLSRFFENSPDIDDRVKQDLAEAVICLALGHTEGEVLIEGTDPLLWAGVLNAFESEHRLPQDLLYLLQCQLEQPLLVNDAQAHLTIIGELAVRMTNRAQTNGELYLPLTTENNGAMHHTMVKLVREPDNHWQVHCYDTNSTMGSTEGRHELLTYPIPADQNLGRITYSILCNSCSKIYQLDDYITIRQFGRSGVRPSTIFNDLGLGVPQIIDKGPGQTIDSCSIGASIFAIRNRPLFQETPSLDYAARPCLQQSRLQQDELQQDELQQGRSNQICATLEEELAFEDNYAKLLVNRISELSERKTQLKFKANIQKSELANITFQEKQLIAKHQSAIRRIDKQQSFLNSLSHRSRIEANVPQRGGTKYSSEHYILFQADNTLEEQFGTTALYEDYHKSKKGVANISSHRINVENLSQDGLAMLDTQLFYHLYTIPRDEDIKDEHVGYTKISLNLHGRRDGNFAVRSGTTGKKKIIQPESIGKLLSQHLIRGDYGGKLTIAFRACHVGRGGNESSLKKLADMLKSNGYTGVKLTGSKDVIGVKSCTDFNQVMGSQITRIESDGQIEKFSTSMNKVEIYI